VRGARYASMGTEAALSTLHPPQRRLPGREGRTLVASQVMATVDGRTLLVVCLRVDPFLRGTASRARRNSATVGALSKRRYSGRSKGHENLTKGHDPRSSRIRRHVPGTCLARAAQPLLAPVGQTRVEPASSPW